MCNSCHKHLEQSVRWQTTEESTSEIQYSLCQKAFVARARLNNHSQPSLEKNHTASIYIKVFSQESNLIIHMKHLLAENHTSVNYVTILSHIDMIVIIM